jgi:hypothetical protein
MCLPRVGEDCEEAAAERGLQVRKDTDTAEIVWEVPSYCIAYCTPLTSTYCISLCIVATITIIDGHISFNVVGGGVSS